MTSTRAAFGRARLLVGGFFCLSVLTLVAAAALRNHPALVNDAVWIRGGIVAADGLLMLAFTARAARGSRGAYRRARILSAITIAAVAVIVALPGTIPAWMKAEQAVCGLIMIAVAAILSGGALRSAFGRG
jgi:hypothetical protein